MHDTLYKSFTTFFSGLSNRTVYLRIYLLPHPCNLPLLPDVSLNVKYNETYTTQGPE
jgi:hypothetical protein